MISFLRIIKFSVQDILRNFSLSFMTVLILVLMLLSVNTLFFVNVLTNEAIKLVKEQIDVSLYFSNDVSDAKIKEVQSYINSFPEVKGVKFLTREEVLAQFKEQHQDNPEIISSLAELGDNPLGPTMIVKTREPQDYQKIMQALSVPEYENIIEAKTFGDTEKVIARIQTVTTQVERFAGAVSVLFIVIAFLIIFNTVRVAIYTQRTEISIKKLVGATNWFVRGPYLFESFIFSVFSIVITFVLLFTIIHFIEPYITVVFGQVNILTNYYNSHIMALLLAQFGAVLFLTVATSLLAMRRHLKV